MYVVCRPTMDVDFKSGRGKEVHSEVQLQTFFFLTADLGRSG